MVQRYTCKLLLRVTELCIIAFILWRVEFYLNPQQFGRP